jgi:hypothetical protein
MDLAESRAPDRACRIRDLPMESAGIKPVWRRR